MEECLNYLEEQITQLGLDNWSKATDSLLAYLKPKFQGKGILKSYRDIFNATRNELLENNEKDFLSSSSLDNIDERINLYTKRIREINYIPQHSLYHNFYQTILNNPELEEKHPECFQIAKIIAYEDSRFSNLARVRLVSIISRLTVESGAQSNKSNAGGAGENFVRMLLSLAGLEEGVDFREQYKSKAGSDTDFVFPFAEHYHDYDVQIFLAVQFSSNDRLRLVSSELKAGAECYSLTGNGLDASTKKLKDIGNQIIQGVKERNHKLICYGPEISRELNRLKKLRSSKTQEVIDRIQYFENYALSFETFAKRLRTRFARSAT